MTAKEYLSQIRSLDVKIAHMEEELKGLREKAVSTSQVFSADRVQTSVNGDRMAKLVDACLDLEAEIAKMCIYLLQQRLKIVSEIHRLSDYRYIELLYWKYVCNKRLEDVAETMRKRNGESYSYEHILALHGEALRAFAEIMPV